VNCLFKHSLYSGCQCEINTKFWSENLKGKHHLEDLGEEGNIILEWIWRK